MEILLDPISSDAEKDDAVIELGKKFQDDETIDILINVSKFGECDEMIAASCGETIAHIYLNNQRIDYDKLFMLNGIALSEALSLIKAQRPNWYKTFSDLYQI